MSSKSASQLPRVIVLGVQVPFTSGGAEILCNRLVVELKARGYTADLVTLPYTKHSKVNLLDSIRAWSELDLSSADLVIATKFPTYFIKHPNKVLWLVHQHRQMYELLGSRFSDFQPEEYSEALRRKVVRLERQAISECQVKTCISLNVAGRLKRYLGIDSIALPPPLPLGSCYRSGKKGEYILSVGRLCSIKRVELILRALPNIHNHIRLKIVGVADEAKYDDFLMNEAAKHHLTSRIDFLGRVSDDQLIDLYADSLGVFYGPFDEDYGFVTLEALKSRKPVVTCKDSGGVLGFIEDEINGLVVEPTPNSIAAAFNRLCDSGEFYQQLVANSEKNFTIPTWDEVIDTLLSSYKELPKTISESVIDINSAI